MTQDTTSQRRPLEKRIELKCLQTLQSKQRKDVQRRYVMDLIPLIIVGQNHKTSKNEMISLLVEEMEDLVGTERLQNHQIHPLKSEE